MVVLGGGAFSNEYRGVERLLGEPDEAVLDFRIHSEKLRVPLYLSIGLDVRVGGVEGLFVS